MALPGTYVIATLRYGTPDKELQLNVFYYTVVGAIGGADNQADADTIATQLAANFSDPISAITTTETDIHGVFVQYNIGGNVFTSGQPCTSLAGLVASDTLPEYCAVIIQKRTAHGGRSGRGRSYIGCVPEDATDNGEITGPFQVLYDQMGDAIINHPDVGGAHLDPQLFSKKDNAFYPLVSRRTDIGLGTQRRRKTRPLL